MASSQMPFDGAPMNYTFANPDATRTNAPCSTTRCLETARSTLTAGRRSRLHRSKRPWILNAEGTLEGDVWELYNLKEDFSQSNNVAEQYPEKLVELKALFEKACASEQRLSARRRRRPAIRRDAGAGRTSGSKNFIYYPPAAIRVHESVSPRRWKEPLSRS